MNITKKKQTHRYREHTGLTNFIASRERESGQGAGGRNMG